PRARRFLSYSCSSIERGFELLRTLIQAGLRPEVARLYDPIDSILLGQSSDPKKSQKSRNSGLSGAFGAVARRALAHPQLLQRAIEALEGNVLGGATLLLIFEGTSEQANDDAERAARLCRHASARSLGEGPARAWLAHRYSVSFRQSSAFRLGAFTDTMEVAAPWSKLEAVYHDVRAALSEHALVMAHLSHAYPDGCSIYFTFSALGRTVGHASSRYDAAWRAGLGTALAAGANLSHHHGVGRSKAGRLAAEIGQGTELLNRLRHGWDPSGLFNPGALSAPFEVEPALSRECRSPFVLDEKSLLAEADAQLSLGGLEALLSRRGFTLGLSGAVDWSSTVADWLGRGFPGARDAFDDPVASRVAGFEASAGGVQARVRAAPRRATGPDLLALFAGTRAEIGAVERVTLAIRRRGAPEARVEPFRWDRDPPLGAAEARAFELARRALRSP
ncbi:MAG TPA: FAD-linked oxidase C-terminal domain-containing protein, partial [Polyangiaceae bacterium]|nr:FAD-linked oxidase C-terminal domain-containing protein [Polyangiaceae bacterium]